MVQDAGCFRHRFLGLGEYEFRVLGIIQLVLALALRGLPYVVHTLSGATHTNAIIQNI